MTFHIKAITASDFEVFCVGHGEDINSYNEIGDKLPQDYAEMLGIFAEAKLVGFVSVVHTTHTSVQIGFIYLCVGYRRKGYGKQLIKFVMDKYERTATAITVNCPTLLRPFFEACGFFKRSSYCYMTKYNDEFISEVF